MDELGLEQPALASCYGASLSDRQLLGTEPGERTRKLVHPVRELSSADEGLAEVGGVNVHVGAAVGARDRRRLERLCRYVARPPIAQERLEVTPAGRVLLRFKRVWRSGAHAVVLDPLDFIARLVALIPPPHFNMLRYHGVLAARAKARAEVVPGPSEEPGPAQLRLVFEAKAEPGVEVEAKRSSRHPWAWLLRRVFAVDVLTCVRCEGRMRLIKLANTPEELSRVLAKVGLGPRPPPRRRPALPGQLELKFAA